MLSFLTRARLLATPAVDEAIAGAKSLPELVAAARATSPELAARLEGKSMLACKGPLGAFLSVAVTYASTRYGFGWDDATVNLVTGAVLLAAGYAVRALGTRPVNSLA